MPADNFVIVADDLTGSADSALPFWRAGRRSVVVFDPAQPWPENPGVLSLCTHTRAMAETEAGATLTALGPRIPAASRLFKKIDSTLRGWIGTESLALLRAQSHRRAVFGPAYPSKGRTLAPDGVYRVHGVPLAETEFAAEVSGLDKDSRLNGFLVRHFGALAATMCVLPATDDAGLRTGVQSVAEPALWIGSPGLAIALAGPASLPPSAPQPPTTLAAAPIVVAAGSRRSLTRQQVATLTRALPPDTAAGILRTPDIIFEPGQALSLADELGARAAAAARKQGRCGLILTGGDIAAATCRHLGIASAEIVGEVEDGLPVLRAGELHLVTKAGGFGDDFSLVRAYARLAQFLS